MSQGYMCNWVPREGNETLHHSIDAMGTFPYLQRHDAALSFLEREQGYICTYVTSKGVKIL